MIFGNGPQWGRGLTSGAVGPDPAWVTLAGTIDGVTGTVVGAQAGLSTRFTKLPSGTHCGHTYSHTGHMGPATPTHQRATPTHQQATPIQMPSFPFDALMEKPKVEASVGSLTRSAPRLRSRYLTIVLTVSLNQQLEDVCRKLVSS